jgi:hypothetical protein
MTDPRYPIGRFQRPASIEPAELLEATNVIDQAPTAFRAAVEGWTDAQLDTPYREGGWTVRQVLHHVPESHMNSYIRFKLALTEVEPTIKPYDESAWAELPDGKAGPIEPSLRLLENLHDRWVFLLRGLSQDQWQRTFNHPQNGTMRLDMTALLYAWHCRHHLAHITSLAQRMGW